jgi:hypothetical protein
MRWRPLLLGLALAIGCTAETPEPPPRAEPHAACEIVDEDRRCTVDEECVYLGTYVESHAGECCYDPCGGGSAVNREASERLTKARQPMLEGPRKPNSRCHDRGDVKCTYGGVYCVAGFCEQRDQPFR